MCPPIYIPQVQIYPRALGSRSVTSYDSQGYTVEEFYPPSVSPCCLYTV
jgi:hypothetical protein